MAEYTANEVITAARYEVEDSAAQNYDDDEMVSRLAEAVRLLWREITNRAPWYFDSTTYLGEDNIVLVAGVSTYALPADFLAVRLVKVNGYETFNLAIEDEADSDASGYMLRSGQLYLLPEPSEAGTATLYYVPKATVPTAMGEDVPLSEEFFDLYKQYVAYASKVRNTEDSGGTAMLYKLIRGAVGRFVMGRNMPAGAGAKVYYHRWI